MISISRLSCSSSIEGSPGCRSPPHPCRCSSRRRERPAAREGEGQLHACGVQLRDFRGLGRFVGAIRWAGGRAPRRERRCTDGSFKRTLRRSRARRVVERPESRAYGLHHPHPRPCSPEIRGWGELTASKWAPEATALRKRRGIRRGTELGTRQRNWGCVSGVIQRSFCTVGCLVHRFRPSEHTPAHHPPPRRPAERSHSTTPLPAPPSTQQRPPPYDPPPNYQIW